MDRANLVADARELFASLNINEINAVLAEVRTSATEAKKAVRAVAKAEAKAQAQAETAELVAENLATIDALKAGAEVIVTIGSGKNAESVEGVFVKKTDKRFTVNIDGANKSIMFHKFIGLVGAFTASEQAEADEEFPQDSAEVDSDDFVEESEEALDVAM